MKLAIITGHSKGLGQYLAEDLIQKGFNVWGLSRSNVKDRERLQSFSVDLSQPQVAIDLLEECWENLSDQRLESFVLVNNAALLAPINPVGKCSHAQTIDHISVNITAPLILSDWFIKKTQELDCPKQIITISSGAAKNAYASWSNYCCTKAAIEMMARVIEEEQKSCSYPVSAWSYNPGVMDTQMQGMIREQSEENFPMIKKFTDLHEQDALKDPGMVAKHLCQLIIETRKGGEVYPYGSE
jgi:benzil reductase ((S)-benzoin forming)